MLKNHQELGAIHKPHGVRHLVMNGSRYIRMSSSAVGIEGLDALGSCKQNTHDNAH